MSEAAATVPFIKGSLPKPSKPVAFRTLGPVSDLEMHLPPEWWKTLFNALYLKTDGDVVENAENTVSDVDALISVTGINPEQHVVDLCCGQGRHSLELASRGFQHVAGIDRSRYLIRVARKRARSSQFKVAFSEGDARKIRLSESSQDCVFLMGNSFGYFEREEDDRAVLAAIKRVLKSGGKIALDIVNGEWMRENFEPRSWEWIDQNHFVCRERSLSADRQRIVSREVIVHAEEGVIADQFYAERLYTRDQIRQLLEDTGFQGVEISSNLFTNSTRGQDLGMMANRMFVVGSVRKEPKLVGKKSQKFRPETVTILFNDPDGQDPYAEFGNLKTTDLLNVFKEGYYPEDNYLKDTLAKVEAFKFDIIHDHKNLLQRFMENPPQMVFNLCDMGYRNNPRMELHLPAIMDMLKIPYTGSGPGCLAMCYDKSAVRSVASELGVPVPLETMISNDTQSVSLPTYFPALVKPNYSDGSYGITEGSVVNSAEELINWFDKMKQLLQGPLLIQEFLRGREFSVAVLGNPGSLKVLPIMEVDYSEALKHKQKAILGLEAHWLDDYSKNVNVIPAEIDEETKQTLADYATVLFERLGCRDYARFDFRQDSAGEIKLLEANPNPGIEGDRFLDAAKLIGMTFESLLEYIIEAAIERMNQSNGV